jgi:hypothetical protein
VSVLSGSARPLAQIISERHRPVITTLAGQIDSVDVQKIGAVAPSAIFLLAAVALTVITFRWTRRERAIDAELTAVHAVQEWHRATAVCPDTVATTTLREIALVSCRRAARHGRTVDPLVPAATR